MPAGLQDAPMTHSMVHNFHHEPSWPTVANMSIVSRWVGDLSYSPA